ncbi:MAG: lantibiotic dehydratase [Pseudomarimonas sp.]
MTALRVAPARAACDSLFEPESYFVLRTPLLPVNALIGANDRQPVEDTLAAMRALWDDPRVGDAIHVASASLHERLQAWHWRLDSKKDLELAGSLYNYLSRMCTRPTPFGLCAAVSVGTLAEATRMQIDAMSLRRHTRLDTAVIASLGEHLARHPELRHRLRLRANDCGHRVGDRWHYVEWQLLGGLRVYTLSSVGISEPLMQMLAAARHGGRTAAELAAALIASDAEIDQESAYGFIDSLVENCLLIPAIEPRLTGAECLPAMIGQLSSIDPSAHGLDALVRADERIRSLDRGGPGCSASDYSEVVDLLQPVGAKLRHKRLFQVDLYREGDTLHLSSSVADEIARAAELTMRLGASRSRKLDQFCSRFTARYEGRRMPLLEVLDPEVGIGDGSNAPDPSPLLAGIELHAAVADDREAAVGALLVRRWHDAQGQALEEIVLDPDDLPEWDTALRAAVPSSAHAMATLLAPGSDAVDRGNYQLVLHGVTGPGAANMFGRFCFGSAELSRHVRANLTVESQAHPDAVIAEIVHLPQERMGNLACRPLFRDYEIPLLGNSGAPLEYQITPDDLEIEVRGNNVLLWSRRLNKRVIPRMSNAHNYETNALGLYRFLGRVQFQGHASGQFHFPEALASLPRLPRVRCGRVILALARWRLTARDAAALLKADRPQQLAQAEALRARFGMPRQLGMAEGDNVQAIDLANPLALEALCRALRKTGEVRLVEALYDPATLCVGADSAAFAHEIVLPLRRSPQPVGAHTVQPAAARSLSHLRRFEAAAPAGTLQVSDRERRRLPGSDWLYFRIYGSTGMLDRVLGESLAPLAEQLRRQGACTRWFYIRYGDPEWHLRLRLQGIPERLNTCVLPQLCLLLEQLSAQRLINRIEIGSYEREIERYGGPGGLAVCERWFCQESARVAALLDLLRDGDPNWRWQLAATCLVGDLQDFGLQHGDLADLFTFIATGFKQEFRMEKQRLGSLGDTYRRHASAVQAACNVQLPEDMPAPLQKSLLAVLHSHAAERSVIGTELRELKAQGLLWGSVEALLPSLVHMSCNRWFADTPRANEMVLYELIRRGLAAVHAKTGSGALHI